MNPRKSDQSNVLAVMTEEAIIGCHSIRLGPSLTVQLPMNVAVLVGVRYSDKGLIDSELLICLLLGALY